MATIQRFEDLQAWQRARALVNRIYAVTRSGGFAADFALRDQIRRAAISVASNIAEGFERSGRGEFLQFLAMAKGSNGEVRAQLYLAFDQRYLAETELTGLVAETNDLGNMIGGLMQYLASSPLKGAKYKRPVAPHPTTRNSKPETRN